MQSNLFQNKKIESINYWFLLQPIILIFSLILYTYLLNNLILCFICYSICSISSLRLFRFLPRLGHDFMDPGFLLVFFNILTIIPMTISLLIGLEVVRNNWSISQNYIFVKVVYLHLIFIAAFTIPYYLLNRNTKPNTFFDNSFLYSNVWIYLFVILFFVIEIINFSSGNYYIRAQGNSGEIVRMFSEDFSLFSRQIFSRISGLKSISLQIAIGVIMCRAKTIKRARLYMILLPLLLFIYSFIVHGSRGAATTLIPIIAFADIVKWKGRLLNWPLFIFIFFGGFLFMHYVEVLETFFLHGYFGNWQVALFTALEPRMVENVGAICTMVDELGVPLKYGTSYIDGIRSLVPTQLLSKPVVPLSHWFIYELYGISYLELGTGYAFSAIAEGYLNFKLHGVVFSGVLMALMASLIRYFKCSKRIPTIGPLLFTSTILMSYKLLRSDFVNIIKRFEWIFILVFILIIVVTIILHAIKDNINVESKNLI